MSERIDDLSLTEFEDLDEALERMNDAFFVLDRKWRFTYLNSKAEELLQEREEELLGKNVWEEFPEAVELDFYDEYHRAMEEQTSVTFEEYYPPLDTLFRVNAYPSQEGLSVYFQDITDQKKREEDLKREKEFTEGALNALDDIFFVFNEDQEPLRWNERVNEVTGYTDDEIRSMCLTDFIVEDDRELVDKAFEEVLAGEEDRVEAALLTKDGEEIPYEFSGSLLTDSDGNVLGMSGIGRSITKRKEMERRLKTRVRQQEVIVELGQRALQGVDLDKLMEKAVERVAKTLGMDYAKVLEFQPEEDNLLLRAGVGWTEGLVREATVGAGRDSQAGYTLLSEEPVIVEDLRTEERFSGPLLLVDHNVVSGMSVIIGSRDDPWGVFGTHTTERREFNDDDVNFIQAVANILADAIERKESKESLIQERDRFESLFDNLPIPAVDVVYEDDLPVVERINSAFEEVFGYGEDEIVGENINDYIVPPSESDRPHEVIERILRGEKVRTEVRRVTSDGVRDFILNAVPRVVDDETVHAYGIYTDITDRKQRERKIEVLNRVLRHDLRNDANVIIGNAELVHDIIPDDLEEKQRLETIIEKSSEMIEMSEKARKIHETLSKGGVEKEPIDIVEILEERLKIVRRDYPGVDIEADLPESQWVYASPLIDSALDNVIENAIEHNDKENPRVHVSVSQVGEQVNIEVADNGPGIPGEEIEILEKGKETELKHTSGIGLWLINWIVKESGGEVEFSENDPDGSIVTIKLHRGEHDRSN